MDSESRNRTAQDLFKEKKIQDTVDSYLSLAQCLPDIVHVAKRMSRQFSNWYLIVNGYRVNRVQLRTLRNDPILKSKIREHLTVAACRNRDRMDVDLILEISSTALRQIIQSEAGVITNTLIPQKFRLYDGNKRANPSSVCTGPAGQVFLVDSSKGKLFSARLHYPVDVTEICSSLKVPLAVAYKEGVVYVGEYTGKKISYVDLQGKTVYNPENMSVKELKVALGQLNLLKCGDGNLKKKDLQQRLWSWIRKQGSQNCPEQSTVTPDQRTRLNLSKQEEANSSKKKLQKGTLKMIGSIVQPTALHFRSNGNLFVADRETNTILEQQLQSNGMDITASNLQKIGHHTQVFGLAILHDTLYVASSCLSAGGIFRHTLADVNNRNVDSDVLPKKLLANNSTHCGKVHGVALLRSQKELVLTDVANKTVKVFSLSDRTVEILAGAGEPGQRDGNKAEFYQPTAVCTEYNSTFICDTAIGKLRMVTKTSGLLEVLENLEKLLHTFGVWKEDKGQTIRKFTPAEAVVRVKEIKNFLARCELDVREFACPGDDSRVLQGPDGVNSSQTVRDIKLIIQTLERLISSIQEITPSLLGHIDLKSLTTLVVENLFSEMREGNEMPLVLQFSYRFTSGVREYIKRITQTSFTYFTSESSCYSKHLAFLPFNQFTFMSKPSKNTTLTKSQLDEMRLWRAEFGQSVRQQSVRNMTTKDATGTLPLNCYETKMPDPKPLDFTRIDLEQQNQTDERNLPEVLFKTGSVVCVGKGYQPLELQPSPIYLAKLKDNLYETRNASAQATFFTQDPMLPFQFVEDVVTGEIRCTGIVSVVSDYQEEDDIIVVEENLYYILLVASLDNGDTTTFTEAEEEDQDNIEEIQTGHSTQTRVARRRLARSASNTMPIFVFY